MLIVKVFVNDLQIDEIAIQNVSKTYGVGKQEYVIRKPIVKDLIITHEFSKGYIPLVKKALTILQKLKHNTKVRREDYDG